MDTREPDYSGVRVLVVSAFDSFLRAAQLYARHLEARGAHVAHRLYQARPGQLSLDQARATGLSAVPSALCKEDLVAEMMHGYDVVLLALDGARTRRVIVDVHETMRADPKLSRPLLVSLLPGILFRFQYESMFCRMSADLLLLSSPHDLALYEQVKRALAFEADNGLMTGLSAVPSLKAPRPTPPADGPIVFVAQPTVPAWRHERMYVVDRLAALAERCQRKQVIIKPRHRRHETTLHVEEDPLEDVLEELARRRDLPENLRVSHEPLRALLERASACITFSSTAALEALALGVPARVISDLGIHEHLGTHFFLESGLLAPLDALTEDLDYRLEEGFRRAHVASAEDHLADFDARLGELLAARAHTPRLPLPGGRLFGRPASYDAFIRARYDVEHLTYVAEKKPGPKKKVQQATQAVLKALRLR